MGSKGAVTEPDAKKLNSNKFYILDSYKNVRLFHEGCKLKKIRLLLCTKKLPKRGTLMMENPMHIDFSKIITSISLSFN